MRHAVTRLRGGTTAVIMLMPTLMLAVPLRAQSSALDTTAIDTTGIDTPHRPPQLALVAPSSGESLPQDKPSIVLRYARGALDDPLDLTSLVVLVDGEDRSSQFHADSTEAWGSIDPLTTGRSAGQPLALGVHQLVARICSARGICVDLRETVTIGSPMPDVGTTPTKKHKSQLIAVIAPLLAFIERLFIH